MSDARPDDDDASMEEEADKAMDLPSPATRRRNDTVPKEEYPEMDDTMMRAESILLQARLGRSSQERTTNDTSREMPQNSTTPASPSVPGAFGVARPRPSSSTNREAATMASSDAASVNASSSIVTDGSPFERAYRVQPRQRPAPTTPLPKYALRDGVATGSVDASMPEEEVDSEDDDDDDDNGNSTAPPSSIVYPTSAEAWNFPPIEAFSAPAEETEALQVAVPFVDDDDDPKRTATASRRRALWLLLAMGLVVGIATVVGVCADGSCGSGSSSPIPPEISARDAAIYEYINEISLAAAKPFSYLNQSQPEERALRWIVAEDPLQLSSPPDDARIRQRYALLTLWYYNMPSNPWLNATGWLEFTDECSWFGISCDNATVTGIDLDTNGIQGALPPDLALLTDLQDLSMNCQLTYARSNASCLSGTVPPSLATLPRLRRLNFDNNNLTGPVSLWLGNWSDLEKIDISLNNMTGTLPAEILGMWTRLSSFDFGINRFTGRLPDTIARWTHVATVVVTGNWLTGTLPAALGAWTNLTFIDVSDNRLTGTIPREVEGNWTQLYSAKLFPNNFTGSIPDVICNVGGCDNTSVIRNPTRT